jgi:hypothetical protein
LHKATNIAVRCTLRARVVARSYKYSSALHLGARVIARGYKYFGALHLRARVIAQGYKYCGALHLEGAGSRAKLQIFQCAAP